MKAKHRHELKTNELAEWLANLPKWAKENLRMIIYFAVVAVLVLGAWIWKAYQKNIISVNERLQLSRLLEELTQNRLATLRQQGEGFDVSYMLIQTANKLQNFARATDQSDRAALAFIKSAEALRTELHYRMGRLDNQTVSSQIAKARTAYERAIEKSKDNPSLRGLATLGLGLCEEEVRNFDKAREIYQQIVKDAAFAPTTVAASAQHRLKIMDNYTQMVVFKSAQPTSPPAPEPVIMMSNIDMNMITPLPSMVNSPVEE
jgi:tetratricopeptide (TPR) repeat protein